MKPELQSEIEQYFKGMNVAEDLILRAIAAINNAAHTSERIDTDILGHYRKYITEVGLKRGDEFYYALTTNFAPRHYKSIVEFIKKIEQDEEEVWEAKLSQEQETESVLEKQRRLFKDDYEYGDVPGEVIVYRDRIMVHALGYREGFKDSLPKGGKYQGKGSGCWEYPITMKDVFTVGDTYQSMPVLYAEGMENPYGVKQN
jgi:hypothetical protein